MAEEKDRETKFRIGATHAATWFREEAKRMAKEGKTAQEISDHLGDLNQVLIDWRNDWINPYVGLPSEENPWEWKAEDLKAFIAKRKREW